MKRFWCWLRGHKLRYDRTPVGGVYVCDRCNRLETLLLSRRDIFGRFG